jgi:hypothetical protein
MGKAQEPNRKKACFNTSVTEDTKGAAERKAGAGKRDVVDLGLPPSNY